MVIIMSEKEILEKLEVMQNQLTSMNKYYAEALSKTFITNEEIQKILKHIDDIKEQEGKNVIKRKSRNVKSTSKKRNTSKGKKPKTN